VKALTICKINTDFSCSDFYEKIKSNKDFLKKVLSTVYSTDSVIGRMCKFINAYTLFCFSGQCIILIFLGVFTIGIQNSYMLQLRYEHHLSDKARCSEVSRFLITKIWYVYT